MILNALHFIMKVNQNLINNQLEKEKSRQTACVLYAIMVKGAFSYYAGISDITGSLALAKKTGRGSRPYVGSGASSSISPYCKDRKEVLRQR